MSLSNKSRRNAGLLILAVTGLLAVTPMLSGCGGSGREEALKQAVYVGTGGYDPANDGKIVIVCGKLELLEPAYDEDLGITIEAPHVMRYGQKLKKKELNQAMTGNNMEWNSNFQYGDFIGKADVGEFHLGEDFLQNMMVRYDPDLDEKMLEEAGYAIVRDFKGNTMEEDKNARPYVGTARMGRGVYEEGDVRYDYTVPGPKPGEMVTIIGIQNQDTINYVEGTYENMLSGELDKDTAIRKTTHP